MANYQSNMRYGRMGNSYAQQRQNRGNMMMPRETCGCQQSVRQEEQRCGCSDIQPQEKREERRESVCRCMEERIDRSGENECREDLACMPLAMAYVPWQKWCNIYEICKGFQRGTIFGELDKPFLGRGGCNR